MKPKIDNPIFILVKFIGSIYYKIIYFRYIGREFKKYGTSYVIRSLGYGQYYYDSLDVFVECDCYFNGEQHQERILLKNIQDKLK